MQYILVPGAWHGSWCWEKVAPLLKEKGHQVKCIDMPDYTTNPTYQDYYCHLEEAIYNSNQPVVLVAHSMGRNYRRSSGRPPSRQN